MSDREVCEGGTYSVAVSGDSECAGRDGLRLDTAGFRRFGA